MLDLEAHQAASNRCNFSRSNGRRLLIPVSARCSFRLPSRGSLTDVATHVFEFFENIATGLSPTRRGKQNTDPYTDRHSHQNCRSRVTGISTLAAKNITGLTYPARSSLIAFGHAAFQITHRSETMTQ